MKSVFCSGLVKDFAANVLKHIKETGHVKEDIAQDILPGALNKFDQHHITINLVHITMSDHHKNTSIEYIDNTVEKTVDKVVHVRMKHVTSYVGSYDELALDIDENMVNLQTTNINTVTAQAHGNKPENFLPK